MILPEPADYIDLEVQCMRAHYNMQGDYLDNGQYELQNGETHLTFPVYEEKDLKFLDKNTEIGR